MYFSARTEGRISYGHLGRTNSCWQSDTVRSDMSGRIEWTCKRWHFNKVSYRKQIALRLNVFQVKYDIMKWPTHRASAFAVDPKNSHIFISNNVQNLVVVSHTVSTEGIGIARTPKNLGYAVAQPIRKGRGDPLDSLTCLIMPTSVKVTVKPYERNYGDPPRSWSIAFRGARTSAFQGQLRTLSPTRIDQLRMTSY